MKVLVCNAGSTSLKIQLFDMPSELCLCRAKIERMGSCDDAVFYYVNERKGMEISRTEQNIPDYRTGIEHFLKAMLSKEHGVLQHISEVDRVGFKTVLAKGYYGVHELTEPVLVAMEEMLPVAPTHNGLYLEAIRIFREVLPSNMFVGTFETAFHQSIPQYRTMFGVPYEWYEKLGLRRLGYHGISHGYIADKLNQESAAYRAISCHLGGSCSLCAIRDGKSIDTSFGFTVQSGIIHANRVGSMDCDVVLFLMSTGMTMEEIKQGLTKNGGLLGISGVSKDLRYVEEAAKNGNERAQLGIDVLVGDIVRYIGAFYAELGGLDRLVFTGGIGENSAMLREKVCSGLTHLGIELSSEKNASGGAERIISSDRSAVKVQIISAKEELEVARRTYEYIG